MFSFFANCYILELEFWPADVQGQKNNLKKCFCEKMFEKNLLLNCFSLFFSAATLKKGFLREKM